jgi:cytidylate kinase
VRHHFQIFKFSNFLIPKLIPFFVLMPASTSSGKIIIAIDGYSSCGKSTIAKAIAKNLNYIYIDSGAMYRAITYFVQQHSISLLELQTMKSEEIVKMMAHVQISFKVNPENGFSEIFLNGVNVEKKIRELKVSDWVSPVSAIPAIRHLMVLQQQSYGKDKGLVMDGRDIGTTVFPNAELKIFMIANKEIRAKRRFDEMNSKGFMVSMDEVLKNNEERDQTDTTRKESPLRKAQDAIVLDNSSMNEKEQLEFAMGLVEKALATQNVQH